MVNPLLQLICQVVLVSLLGIDFYMFVTNDVKPKYEVPNLFIKHITTEEIARRVANVLKESGLANILGLFRLTIRYICIDVYWEILWFFSILVMKWLVH